MKGRGQIDMRGHHEKTLRCGCCVAYGKRYQIEKAWKKKKPQYFAEAIQTADFPRPIAK